MEQELEYKGYTIKIELDEIPSNPIEEWDGNAKYCLFHSRYSLQNDTDLKSADYSGWQSLKKALIRKYRPLAILPVYMYDHSGQTIATTPFSCRWDSGQIGFVFVNKETLKSWGYKSRRGYEKACGRTLEDDLVSNVKLYDNYISGEVYGFIVEEAEGEQIDSCWGFYGDEGVKDAIEDAKATIDYKVKAILKTKLDKLKKLVKYHVPLNLRGNILA